MRNPRAHATDELLEPTAGSITVSPGAARSAVTPDDASDYCFFFHRISLIVLRALIPSVLAGIPRLWVTLAADDATSRLARKLL